MDRIRLRKLIVVVVLSMLILVGAAVFFYLQTNKDSGVGIKGYPQEVASLPEEARQNIENSLKDIIKKNNQGINYTLVKDATVREGSVKYDNGKRGQYAGSFIVDIASLKQSYILSYKYSTRGDPFTAGYPFLAQCPAPEDLIYGDFNCSNLQFSNSQGDGLSDKFVHDTAYYSLVPKDDKTIIITVKLNHTEHTDKFFRQYIADAKKWFNNQVESTEDYIFEYRDTNNNVVVIE